MSRNLGVPGAPRRRPRDAPGLARPAALDRRRDRRGLGGRRRAAARRGRRHRSRCGRSRPTWARATRSTADDLVARRVRFADDADLDRYFRADESCPPTSSCCAASARASCCRAPPSGAAEASGLLQLPVAVDAELVPPSVGAGSVVDVYLVPTAGGAAGRLHGRAGAGRRHRGRRARARRGLRRHRPAAARAGRPRRRRHRFFEALGPARRPDAHRASGGADRDRRADGRRRRRLGVRRARPARRAAGVVVLKRCVDVDDLLAAATAGQADVAVLGARRARPRPAPRSTTSARYEVRPVAVVPGGPRSTRAGCAPPGSASAPLVAEDDLDALPDAVQRRRGRRPTPCRAATRRPSGPSPAPTSPAAWSRSGDRPARPAAPPWRPAGRRAGPPRRRTILVDADPYGGAVAQQLGILDEVSGLLSAARLAAGGMLAERFGSVQRAVGRAPDGRHRAARAPTAGSRSAPASSSTCSRSRRDTAHVVVDTGFSLEARPGARLRRRDPARNQMTLGALDVADEVVVVGAADPVGLSRLARGAGRAARA